MPRIADALNRAKSGSLADVSSSDRSAASLYAASPWELASSPAAAIACVEAPQIHRPERAPVIDRVAAPTSVPVSDAEKLVTAAGMSGLSVAQYGKLAASLHRAQVDSGIKVVMVTSCGPGEGKTLTAANLALTLSGAYHRRVLLVDADLRRPRLHQVFGLAAGPGLADVSGGPVSYSRATALLSVLVAGESRSDASETLTSDAMKTLLADARAEFDWIILDTPPAGLVPDAKLLAPLTDGALLVALSGKTPYDEIQRVSDGLDSNLLLGVVLNGVPERAWSSVEAYGYYGSPADRSR